MTMQTASSSDSSTIQTVELSQKDATSSSSYALIIDASIINTGSASKDEDGSRYRYGSTSWETATDTLRREPSKSSEEWTGKEKSSSPISDDDGVSKRRRGEARRKAEGRNSSTDVEGSSYYTADWESNQSRNSDSDWEESVTSKARSAQHQFFKAKLRLLKKRGRKPGKKTAQEAGLSRPEADEERMFCQKTVQIVENKRKNDEASTKPGVKGGGITSRNSAGDSDVLVSTGALDRLKIENLLSTMKKAAATDVSSVTDTCQCCHELQAASLQRSFIRQRTARLGNELTERRVDWLLNTQDPSIAIGELARELPKPTDDPQEIWNRLEQGIT